ncbi:MAG: transglutaminase family protein, partial [Bacteroidota bacterium]
MSIKAAIYHKTHYKFDRQVNLSPHIIRLRPAAHSRTPIEAYTLKIKPENHFLNWQQDPYGNYLARLVFPEKSDHLSIEVELIADMSVINPFDFFLEESAEKYPFVYSDRIKKALEPYLEIRESGPLLMDLLSEINREEQATMDFLVQVNQVVNDRLGYNIRMETGVQSCEETLEKGRGSCRDFTWLMVNMFRHLGLAARFVSGYSVQLKPDEKPLEGPVGVAEDVTDLHAWVEVYIPGAGWIGLDSTSGLLATEGHIPLACVPDYESAAPIEGATDVCEVEFSFSNEVKRIEEDPRVTKPYTEEQWQNINQLGLQIDEDLQRNQVRLTMGGEPTFVSIDDMEADQWNTKADGAHKRALAWDLSKR